MHSFYEIELARWKGRDISIAVLADLHVAAPWTSLQEIERIVETVNATRPDLIVLAGDYLAGDALPGRREPAAAIVNVLAGLSAPFGTFAILGNHDWQDCPLALQSGNERNSVVDAFTPSGITLLRNDSAVVHLDEEPLWLVGFDSQIAEPNNWASGLHRPDIAFQGVPNDVATILLAHEPDYFAIGDTRADLQISGHTHGGQMNLLGWRPMTPSQHRGRYAYGHIRDGERQLVVSGGIGFSGLPMRIGQAPEITFIKIRRSQSD